MSSTKIDNDHALLAALKADAETAPPIYRAGPYWKPYQERMFRRLENVDVHNFRIDPLIGKGFADTIGMPFDPSSSTKAYALSWLLALPGISGHIRQLRQAYFFPSSEQ